MKRLLCCVLLCLLSASSAQGDVAPSEQIAQLDKEIEHQPRNPSLLIRRADLHRRFGAWGPAIEDLRHAKSLAGRSVGYDFGMARLLEDMGQTRAALRSANSLLQQEPQSAVGLELRARLRAALGRKQAAVQDYDARLALEIKSEPDLWLARARLQLELGETGKALAGAEQGLRQIRACLSLEMFALECEQNLQLFEQALKRIDRLSKTSSRQESWQARRGDIHRSAGQFEAAARCYREALSSIARLSPNRRNTPLVRGLDADVRRRLEELQ